MLEQGGFPRDAIRVEDQKPGERMCFDEKNDAGRLVTPPEVGNGRPRSVSMSPVRSAIRSLAADVPARGSAVESAENTERMANLERRPSELGPTSDRRSGHVSGRRKSGSGYGERGPDGLASAE